MSNPKRGQANTNHNKIINDKRDNKSKNPGSKFQEIEKDSTQKVDNKHEGGEEAGDEVGEKKGGNVVGGKGPEVELQDEFGCKICGKISSTKVVTLNILSKVIAREQF